MYSKKFYFYMQPLEISYSYLILLFLVLFNKESVNNDELLLLKLSVFVNGIWGVNREELFESYEERYVKTVKVKYVTYMVLLGILCCFLQLQTQICSFH